MPRQSIRENLRDLITNLGGNPEGETTTDLIDQLEGMAGGGSVSQADLDAAVERYMESQGDATLTEDDWDYIFGD